MNSGLIQMFLTFGGGVIGSILTLVGTKYKTSSNNEGIYANKTDELFDRIDKLTDERDDLKEQVMELKTQVSQQSKQLSEQSKIINEMNKQMGQLNRSMGITKENDNDDEISK